MMPLKSGAREPLRRVAFSLVELLVVLAIVAALTALSVYVTLSVMEGRRQDNTITNFNTLNKLLQAHWHKVIKDAKAETPSSAVVTLAGGDIDRANIIWAKFRLMEAFPVSYNEIQNLYSTSFLGNYIPQGVRKYNATYKGNIGTRSNATPTPGESSACLVLALSVNRGVATITDKDATLVDADGDGMKEIVDGWNQPIRFYRFPTGNAALNSSAPANSKWKDPLDPQGKLQQGGWANQSTFTGVCHPVAGNPYVIPVLVSSGRDNQFGPAAQSNPPPDPNMAVVSPGTGADDIYSFTLKLGN